MGQTLSRFQLIPEPDHQIAFRVAGVDRLRWHFGPHYPRPFFYPFIGPNGAGLTRMGHPSAPDHDHHRSIWFAHHDVAGNNFWAENQPPRIRQLRWLHLQDGDDEAVMGVDLGWFDAHGSLLLEQRVLAGLSLTPADEPLLEIQSEWSTRIPGLTLARSNFGLLAVRVAKSISRHFGAGALSNADGGRHEPELFAKPSAWVDYSGPVANAASAGITLFPHPSNPDHPAHWHVRDDGWMSPAFTLVKPYVFEPGKPLQLRYLLWGHADEGARAKANERLRQFAVLPRWTVTKAAAPWRARFVRDA